MTFDSYVPRLQNCSHIVSTNSIFVGSSRFSVGLSSDIRDGDELNQREKVVLIPVSISNSLCDLDPVVEAFQLAS